MKPTRFESMIDPGDVVTTRQVTVSLDHVRAELLAWADYNGAANLRPEHVMDLLAQVSLPVPVPEPPYDDGACHATYATCSDRRCRTHRDDRGADDVALPDD